MVIDTSALIAVLTGEEGSEALVEAIVAERGGIPAPAMAEFVRVASNQRFCLRAEAEDMLAKFERRGCATVEFTHAHARIAHEPDQINGSGNGNGDTTNLSDLNVSDD